MGLSLPRGGVEGEGGGVGGGEGGEGGGKEFRDMSELKLQMDRETEMSAYT